MSQNPNHGRAASTGHDEQATTEGTGKYLPVVLGLLKHLQQLPDLNSAVEEANRIENGIPILDNSVKASQDQVAEQRKAMDEISQKYDKHLQMKTAEITNLKEELEETRTRLSKLMAMRMTDNNPNIADLSDQNRPTKLAERYGELYDNEWTDAYEALTEAGSNEKTAINILRDILTKTYGYCRDKCESGVERFEEAFTMMSKEYRIHAKKVDIPEEVLKGFKDYRKAHADEVVEISLQAFLDLLKNDKSELAQQALSVEKFLTSCFRLCWMMSIQDPPIYLDQDTSNGDPLTKDKYKEYTVTGSKIEYLVWPCIYIEKGGAVLYKGVAQCYPEKISGGKPASATARLNNKRSLEDFEERRPTTTSESPDEMERRNDSNQSQIQVAGLNGKDSSAHGRVRVFDHEGKPTNEAAMSSSSEQTMGTDTGGGTGCQPSYQSNREETERTTSAGGSPENKESKNHDEQQQDSFVDVRGKDSPSPAGVFDEKENPMDEASNDPASEQTMETDDDKSDGLHTVDNFVASISDKLPDNPQFRKDIEIFIGGIEEFGYSKTYTMMGEERFQKCMKYCNAKKIRYKYII